MGAERKASSAGAHRAGCALLLASWEKALKTKSEVMRGGKSGMWVCESMIQ